MSKFAIPMPDFNRIYRVIHGAVSIEGQGNPGKACTFFSIIGASILTNHYRIPARPVAGGFAMCIEPDKNILFGRDTGDVIQCDKEAFHMWVQTESHIIDFMAPVFPEAFVDILSDDAIPRRMFQKRIDDGASCIDDLRRPGDFYTLRDPNLSDELIARTLAKPVNNDVIRIADTWFGTRRGKQSPSLKVQSSDGLSRTLELPAIVVNSSW